MQAVIAGKGPDAALFVPEQLVANLMVRGALADMREMDGFARERKGVLSVRVRGLPLRRWNLCDA